MKNRWQQWQAVTLSLLRIVVGILFMPHGAQKLFGAFGGQAVPLASQFGVGGILEFFGGLLILIGLFTRPVAFILAGEMAAAYWMAHGSQGLWPILNQGELAALYCFVFLFLFASGGGDFSIDGWLRKRKSSRT